ncbi:hypothetical protein Tco_0830523, partial [Tanacetum coccineum]
QEIKLGFPTNPNMLCKKCLKDCCDQVVIIKRLVFSSWTIRSSSSKVIQIQKVVASDASRYLKELKLVTLKTKKMLLSEGIRDRTLIIADWVLMTTEGFMSRDYMLSVLGSWVKLTDARDSNSYLKSRGSIKDFVSFKEMITSQLQGKLWLYDEVCTRLCLFCHHQIGEDKDYKFIDLQLIMCGDIVKNSNSYLKSRGSIEDFVSFREMITSQLQGKLWLYDEVRTRLSLLCHHQIGENC